MLYVNIIKDWGKSQSFYMVLYPLFTFIQVISRIAYNVYFTFLNLMTEKV